jgi:hypothetical protein
MSGGKAKPKETKDAGAKKPAKGEVLVPPIVPFREPAASILIPKDIMRLVPETLNTSPDENVAVGAVKGGKRPLTGSKASLY